MTLSEEYLLSEYEPMSMLNGSSKIQLMRNRLNGQICVRKQADAGQEPVYRFLQAHPGRYTPEIYACVRDGTDLIVLEEYLTGQNLDEILQNGCFSEQEAVRIILDLCQALLPLHHAQPQIICRDLKAENVMRTADGEIKLVDFDIARQFRTGLQQDTRLLGTPGYAAPEQFGFRQTDARTDIYALGVLLNQLVTRAFPTEQIAAGPLQSVIRRCTELNPDDRYQCVEDLETALQGIADITGPVPHAKAGAVSRQHQRKTNAGPVRLLRTLPGFRSGTPWKMLLAAAGYLFLTWFWFTIALDSDGIPLQGLQLRLEQCLLWLANMILIGIIWNWRGLRDQLPLVRSRHRLCRLAGYILAAVMLLGAAAVLSVFLAAFFT